MELSESESLGALDDHDRRVGDVDADLDHAGRHQDVGVTADEPVHPLDLLSRRHASVEKFHAQVGEDRRAEAVVLRGCAARPELVGFLDERADDERLAPLAHLGPHELVGGVALLGWDDTRLDRMPSGRHLAQLAEVHVTIERVRKRARDRGRRHREVVGHRSRCLAQALALSNAETMLLVDHDEPEIDHGHAVLDERVGPDDQ
jgi:hypothetical protein